MQAHPEFIFQLDEPRERPARGAVRLRGWVASRVEIDNLRLCGTIVRQLAREERPDVRKAFPAHRFVIGFSDTVPARDLTDSAALEFAFSVAGAEQRVTETLPPPPEPPPLLRRAVAHCRLILALTRARFAATPKARWHAALNALLMQIYIARGGDFRREETDRLLALFAQELPDATVVQIGANDGASGDPLGHWFAQTRWKGLLVEPVPHLCAVIAQRYNDRPDLHVEQVAVAERDGEAPLYRLRSTLGETPEWFNQLATLDRDVLLKHGSAIAGIESLIVEERTPTARLETLLARHRIDRIDLLVVDTEGHDYEILRQVDFARFRPLLVMFEHQHLSAADKALAGELLRAHSYRYAETPEGDTLAWQI